MKLSVSPNSSLDWIKGPCYFKNFIKEHIRKHQSSIIKACLGVGGLTRNVYIAYVVRGCGIFLEAKCLGVISKNNSISKDIIQIEIDPSPSHPIFDIFIFDSVLIMLTSLPPLEFLTKVMKFKGFETFSTDRKTQSPLIGPDWVKNYTK